MNLWREGRFLSYVVYFTSFSLSSCATLGVKMYRTTRSPMMQPLVNSGMGMAPFFKVKSKLSTQDHNQKGQKYLLYELSSRVVCVCVLMLLLYSVFSGDCVRAGAFPGQVLGVHLWVLQHPGMRSGQHPLHQGGERSVSLTNFVFNYVCCILETKYLSSGSPNWV